MKMFNNAKIYNEETSQVFRDAVILERLLKAKIRNFGQSVVMNDPLSPKLGRRYVYIYGVEMFCESSVEYQYW